MIYIGRVTLRIVLVISMSIPLVAGASDLTVGVRAQGETTLNVGQTTKVVIEAKVENPSGPGDGVFTFDLDLIFANLDLGGGNLFEIVNVNRPGVNDGLLGGGDGTPTASGLSGIHGGYMETDRGIGAAARLIEVELRAIAVGEISVTPGPSVIPYGADFVLYESLSPQVKYGSGVSFVIVPEPSMGVVGLLISAIVLGRRLK
jgi:hypothetical protein